MPLPTAAGAGFKPQHFAAITAESPAVGFFEVHAENYMGAGGLPHAQLARLRAAYPLSIHGVGLSIGGRGIDADHLARVKALCDRYAPDSFSEHLAWSSHGGTYHNDLLPLPYTRQTLDRVIAHIDQVQTALGRHLLLENPATYVVFTDSDIPEVDFIREIAVRTGCGLLLDVNNVFVSCTNHGADPRAYLRDFPMEAVGEIHLGGHHDDGVLLIDDHGAKIADPVWTLYAEVIGRTGPLPTLVEWDNDVPDWPTLRAEVALADDIMAGAYLARAV